MNDPTAVIRRECGADLAEQAAAFTEAARAAQEPQDIALTVEDGGAGYVVSGTAVTVTGSGLCAGLQFSAEVLPAAGGVAKARGTGWVDENGALSMPIELPPRLPGGGYVVRGETSVPAGEETAIARCRGARGTSSEFRVVAKSALEVTSPQP